MSGGIKKIVKTVGDVAGDIVDAVEDIIDPVVNVVEDVAKAVTSDPITAIATIGATVTGQTWAIPLINGASTVAKGGNIGDVAKSLALSAIAPTVANQVTAVATNAVTNLGVSAGVSTAIGGVVGKAAVAAAAGSDLKTALMGGIGGEIAKASNNYLSKSIPNFDKLSESQQQSVDAAVTTFVQSGGNVNEGILAGVANSLTDNIDALSPKTKEFNEAIVAATQAGLQGQNAGDAFIGSLNNQGAAELGNKVKTYLETPRYDMFGDEYSSKARRDAADKAFAEQELAAQQELAPVSEPVEEIMAEATPAVAEKEMGAPVLDSDKEMSRPLFLSTYRPSNDRAADDWDAGEGDIAYGEYQKKLKQIKEDRRKTEEVVETTPAPLPPEVIADLETAGVSPAPEEVELTDTQKALFEGFESAQAGDTTEGVEVASADENQAFKLAAEAEAAKTAEEELESLGIAGMGRLDPIYGEFRTDKEQEATFIDPSGPRVNPNYLFEGTGEEFYEPGRGIAGMGIDPISDSNNYAPRANVFDTFEQYGKDFDRGFDQTLDNYLTGVEAAALTMGNEKLTAWAKEARSKLEFEGPSATQEFIKQGEGSNYDWTKLDNAIVEQGANLIAAVIGRIAGATVGGAAGTAVAGPPGTAVGAVVGGLAGPALVESMQIIGPIAMAQAKKNGREVPNATDWAFASGGAAMSGALNAIPFTGKGKFITFGSATKEFVTEATQEATEEFFSTANKLLDSEAFIALGKNMKTWIGAGIISGGTTASLETPTQASKYVTDKVKGVQSGKENKFKGSGVYNQQVLGEPVTKRGTGLTNLVDRSLDEYAFQGPNTAEQDIAAIGEIPSSLTPEVIANLEATGEIPSSLTPEVITDLEAASTSPAFARNENFNDIMSLNLESNQNLKKLFEGATGNIATKETIANTPNDTWKSILTRAGNNRTLDPRTAYSYTALLNVTPADEFVGTDITDTDVTNVIENLESDIADTPAGITPTPTPELTPGRAEKIIGAPVERTIDDTFTTLEEAGVSPAGATPADEFVGTPIQGEFNFDVTPADEFVGTPVDIEAVAEITGKPAEEVTSGDIDTVSTIINNLETNADLGTTITPTPETAITPTPIGPIETVVDPKLETNISAVVNPFINTNIEPPEIEEGVAKEEGDDTLTGLMNINRTAPELFDLDYIYDITRPDIFATAEQAKRYQSPYEAYDMAALDFNPQKDLQNTSENVELDENLLAMMSPYSDFENAESENEDELLKLIGGYV